MRSQGERGNRHDPNAQSHGIRTAALACFILAGMTVPTMAEDSLFDAAGRSRSRTRASSPFPDATSRSTSRPSWSARCTSSTRSRRQDAPLPGRDDPWRRADRIEFSEHAGRAPRLGRRLRRPRLRRLRRRSVRPRPLGILRRRLRQDPQADRRERRAALHRARSASRSGRRRASTPNGPARERRATRRSMPSMPAKSRPSATRA